MAENLIITVNNGTRDISKNLTNINPSTADSDLAVVASALNGLTTNTLVNLERVVRSSIEIPATAEKSSPNLTLSVTANAANGQAELVESNGAYTLKITGWSDTTNFASTATITASYSGSGALSASAGTVSGKDVTIPLTHDQSITFTVAEAGNYDSETVTMRVSYRENNGTVTANPSSISVSADGVDSSTIVVNTSHGYDYELTLNNDAPNWVYLVNNVLTFAPTADSYGQTFTVTVSAGFADTQVSVTVGSGSQGGPV